MAAGTSRNRTPSHEGCSSCSRAISVSMDGYGWRALGSARILERDAAGAEAAFGKAMATGTAALDLDLARGAERHRAGAGGEIVADPRDTSRLRRVDGAPGARLEDRGLLVPHLLLGAVADPAQAVGSPVPQVHSIPTPCR